MTQAHPAPSLFDAAPAVEALLSARRTGQPLAALPEEARPATQAEAYAIQDEVARRIGPVTAWKVGAATPDAVPFRAPINRQTVFIGASELPVAGFRLMGIEAEIVFRFARDLPPRERAWTREEVLAAVGSVHPAFEICDTRFQGMGMLDPLSHMADQMNHGALIVGPAAADWRSLDPVRQPVTLDIDGRRVVETIGGNSAGDPVRLLEWLANQGARSFGGLHAGDVVTTGSCTGTIFLQAGSRSVATFPGLGTIELALV